MRLNEFTQALGSADPTPGGGGAAALTAALGASLVRMVCAVSAGKKSAANHEEKLVQVLAQAEALQAKFFAAIDADAQAFGEVAAVFKMPRTTEEEKTLRTAALQKALITATEAPLALMRLSHEALMCTQELLSFTTPQVASDVGVAALHLRAAIESAWLSVAINLASLKDAKRVDAYRSEATRLLAEAKETAQYIYDATYARL